ncbi:unnamed protein product [Mytilus edulis]|uniref:Resistance to inhibitors of cholinesterase protein 3 N-terminal domain-containing protein n=1 Tax=Mytilus edulis TaxID=6550 RepID=A0A8S3Q385_MYTED|nr:unnamed protein product [Mytilus edulis]
MEKVASTKVGHTHQSATGLSSVRLIVTVVVIVACFTALYPKFFHPIVMRMLGVPTQKQKTEPTHPPNRPSPHGHGNMHGSPDPHHDDIKRHMRPGPHPGMRAAAEMNKQNKQGSSGRGGMMGMLLPVYAFGIIGYLIYTLVKVFGKKDKGENGMGYGKRGMSYGQQQSSDNRPVEPQREEVEEHENKLKGLEDLLDRASNVDNNISTEEMRELQKRLEETEKQMSKILNAMQHVSTKVETVATDDVKAQEQAKANGNSSSDSSPDISSYEVVDKNKEKNSSKVETVKASETKEDTQTETMEDKDKKEEVMSADSEEVKDTEEVIKDKHEEEESGVRQRKGQTGSTE